MAMDSLRVLRSGRLRAVDLINLLALVVGVVSGLFIITGALPALIILPVLAGLGIEGVLRAHPAGRVRDLQTTGIDLVTPVTFSLAAALFFRYAASGYWTLLAAVGTGLLFGAIAYAAYYGQDIDRRASGLLRLVIQTADFAALFALLAVFYSHDLSFPAASLLAGVTAGLVAIDIFRDADPRPADHALYAVASGVFVAQARWALGYVRIDGILASTLLLIGFYIATGVAVAALTRRLDRRAGLEYCLVAAAGLVVIVVGRLSTGS